MKKFICFAITLLAFGFMPAFSQPSDKGAVRIIESKTEHTSNKSELTRFSLDFPGGKPEQFVTVIRRAIGEPLNVIILDKDADVQLPPLKLNNVTVPELFQALKAVSEKTVYVPMLNSSGFTSSRAFTTGYEFDTLDRNVTDNSVWFFHVLSLPAPQTQEKICRFYQLAPYLDHGLNVDDITTAIQTAWKMEGITTTPVMSFHKETKLLIAVGEPNKLNVIDAALKALEPLKGKVGIDPNTGLPLPDSKPQ